MMTALKWFAFALWMALLGAGLIVVTRRTAAYGARSYDLLSRPPLTRLDTKVLDVVMLGHRGLWDDLAAIWTIQLLADPRLPQAPVEQVAKAVTDVTRHHPRIESLYLFGCYVIGYDLHRPEFCERVIQDGLKAFPDSWRLPLTQGLVELDRLHNPTSATAYYAMAASRPGAPEFLRSYATKLMTKNSLEPGDIEQTVDQLFGKGANTRLGNLLDESLRRKQGNPP